jgi:phosphohistidine phosphatase
MNVYLVQHAEAKSKEQDPDRPLTRRGRRDAEATAAMAAKLGVRVDQIRHSGKARAAQTAEILGKALSPSGGVVATSGLGPLDDVRPVAKDVTAAHGPLMLVGHLPFMERLAGYLLAGDSDRTVVKFSKAGIVSLMSTEEGWHVNWIITPEIAGA